MPASRLIHATVGQVALPGNVWVREVADLAGMGASVSRVLQQPPAEGDYIPGSGPQTEFMGPIGRWPDHTPPYDTPATTVLSSWSGFASALSAASPGDVIEITNPSSGAPAAGGRDGPFPGPSSGGQNVLVRPPLGSRAAAMISTSGDRNVHVSRTTFAGFRFGNNRLRLDRSTRSGLLWCEVGVDFDINYNGTTDCFEIEVVTTPDYVLGDGSQKRVFRSRNEHPQTGFVQIGCWIMAPGGAKDLLQTLSGVQGFRIESNVLFTAWDKVWQGNGTVDGFVWRNNWSSSCASDERPPSAWDPNSGAGCTGSSGQSLNIAAIDLSIQDSIILGGVRLGANGATLGGEVRVERNVMMAEVSDDSGSGTPIIQSGNDVSSSHSYASHPPPRTAAVGGTPRFAGDLDQIWHP